jgi:hypothetical protein
MFCFDDRDGRHTVNGCSIDPMCSEVELRSYLKIRVITAGMTPGTRRYLSHINKDHRTDYNNKQHNLRELFSRPTFHEANIAGDEYSRLLHLVGVVTVVLDTIYPRVFHCWCCSLSEMIVYGDLVTTRVHTYIIQTIFRFQSYA